MLNATETESLCTYHRNAPIDELPTVYIARLDKIFYFPREYFI